MPAPAASSTNPAAKKKAYTRNEVLLNVMVACAVSQDLAGAQKGRRGGQVLSDIADYVAKSDELAQLQLLPPSAATIDKWIKEAVAERRKNRPTVLAPTCAPHLLPLPISPDRRLCQH